MKSFMEFVQLKNEAEEPKPAAAPAPAAQQQNTPTNQLLDYLEKNKSNIKHYRKFAKVKARQSAGGEEVQTKLNDRNESEVRTTQPNDWVVSNIESQGENQIVDDKTFRKRYDVANPKGDIYSPKAAEFFGVVYNGEKISFAPPNWGGDIMHIEKGYMIGGPNPNEFNKDFYGIDPVAFSKTYKTADQVAESTWMFEVFGRTNEGVLDSVVGAAKGFVKGAGMVGTGLVDTLGGSKVASARLWADHKLALAQGKKLVDVTSGSGRGGASTTLTYDDGHTLDISSYPPDWLGKLLVKGGSVTYNERPITSSLNPTGMQGLMSNNNESWMRSIFGESPSKKNYDGINEIFRLFGKKPAPAPAAPAAPAKKEPVANCPFCKTKSVVNTTHFEGGGSQRYKHVLQCFKCQKHWSEFYLSKQGAMIDTNNPEENKLAPTRDPIAICPFCNTKSVANSTHFEGGGSQRYASVLQCFKCQQHWSGRNAVIDPEKAIEHDKSDNIAHESCMRSFLAESFKPYKKSPYDW